jgi:hypothetical protein
MNQYAAIAFAHSRIRAFAHSRIRAFAHSRIQRASPWPQSARQFPLGRVVSEFGKIVR